MLPVAALVALAAPPAPTQALEAPRPSPRQVAHQRMGFYGFVHFGINTFTDREWGLGNESPSTFQPTDLDPDQVVRTFKAAGMGGLILTAKHHDGFCLWPTATTRHSVASSTWKEGKGDVVRAFADACMRQGLAFGVYLSPWDRNHKDYGRPAYLDTYRAQLTELLTQYGPLFEVWFDGANGGDGCYGGTLEKRTIDPATYYDWPTTWALVRRHQPGAVIFSDVGPDLRWVGNERGEAGEPCWATFSPRSADGRPAMPGFVLDQESPVGHRDGRSWIPAEADVSIRPGWFHHATEDGRVRSVAQLRDLYLKSVGRGACLNLNVPPDRRGRLADPDVRSLEGFGAWLRGTFAQDLAEGAKTADRRSADLPLERTLELPGTKPFDLVRLEEDIQAGQRIHAWVLEAWVEGRWQPLAKGEAVGACRLVPLARCDARRVRIRVTAAQGAPRLAGFQLFQEAPVPVS